VIKMRKGSRTAATLLALLLAVAGTASAARQGRLIGKVVDPEGRPIADVTVTTTSPAIPELRAVTTTDKKGLFKVDFERLFILYRYRFEKAGYQTSEVEQNWTIEGTERHQFTMVPLEAKAPGDLALASASTPAIVAHNAGVRAYKAEDFATARAKLEEAVGHDPNLRQSWEALSVLHLEERRYAEAAECAEKALALGSTSEAVLQSRWEAYRQLGDQAKATRAREELERFGRLSEEAKRIHNEGVARSKAGDDAGAFARFQEAVALDPNLEPALLGVATTGLKIGRAAEAAAAAESLLKADPQHAEALKIRYNASLKLGDEGKIVESLLALTPLDPTMVRDSLLRLAIAAFEKDDTATAKERFRKVLELDPDHPRAHYQLGLILMREGAKNEAKSHLERFLSLAPDDPDAGTAAEVLEILRKS
jgi:Tfp pilus assembly protein PilF